MPWCKGCKSHHVAPMLWRYAGVKAGARLDSRAPLPARQARPQPGGRRGGQALPALLRAGHARRTSPTWAGRREAARRAPLGAGRGRPRGGPVGQRKAWALRDGRCSDLESPPDAEGVRLIPPGDPYLQKPNRPLLAPEAELRKRLFRPVASPGAVLSRRQARRPLAGQGEGARRRRSPWRSSGGVARKDLEEEAQRVADLRGGSELVLVVD